MKYAPQNKAPADHAQRKAVKPVICYPLESLPPQDMSRYEQARKSMQCINSLLIPAREARCFKVPKGHFFRIISTQGPQVGDLNIWNYHNPNEHFYSGKTRALHGSHLSTSDRLWSNFPALRAMATITHDTLDWYGFDDEGASVHDVIGTRCDPYTHFLLSGAHYHHCCHSNLTLALADYLAKSPNEVERLVHDVLNVFMCTGFSAQRKQYFMKASPVRPDDYLEFFAHMDLLGGLSACPGGDCGQEHSSDKAECYPLLVEIYKPQDQALLESSEPAINGYNWNEKNNP